MSNRRTRGNVHKEIVHMGGSASVLAIALVHLIVSSGSADVVQLISVEKKIEADTIVERSSSELKEIETAKLFIIEFVSKWDVERKYRSTSVTYKKWWKAEALKSAFNKASYDRIEFLKTNFAVDSASRRELTVKTDVHWLLEGYEGTQTFYFVLTKEGGQWVLDRLVH